MNNLIIIITKDVLPFEILKKYNFLIIRDNFQLIDNNHLLLHNKIIIFDYLIFDDFSLAKKLDLLIDDDFIITNTYLESSTERVFGFGKIVLNMKSKKEQLQMILDYITNPF